MLSKPAEIPAVEPRRARVLHGCALLLIIALATAIRLYRLDEQGVWIDEYQTAVFLDAPNLQTMVPIARFYLPENMPLYYVLFYLWAQLTDPQNIPLVRLLSVITGVAAVPLLYLVGQRIFGTRAALIAALLLALSPFHARFAQGIRYNVFLDPFTIITMYALLRAAAGEGRRWWLLHFAANVALLWTHPFVGALYVAQGLFLLLQRLPWRTLLAWGVANVAAIAIAGLWLAPSLALMQGADDDTYMQIPPVSLLAADFLADDALMLNDPFAFQGQTWPWLPERLQEAYVLMHPAFDYALIAIGALVALWACLEAWRKRQAGTHMALLWWLVPPLALLIGSFLLRPMMLPRYSCFASLGLYVLLGGAISAIPVTSARATAIGALLIAYAYQLGLMLPAPTRTDWPAAAHAIAEDMAPGDPVYVSGTWRSWEVFRFNAPPSLLSEPVATLDDLIEASDRQLHQPGAPAHVWAVFHPFVFAHPPLDAFEARLRARGLDVAHRFFPGMNGIHVYRITRAQEPASEVPAPAWSTPFDAKPFLEAIGMTGRDETTRAQAEAALHRTTQIPLLPTPVTLAYTALILAQQGDRDLAIAAASASTKMDPAYPLGHFALAIARGTSGDASGCAEAYARTLETDGFGYFDLFDEAINQLYIHPNQEEARTALQTLDAMGAYIPPVCLQDAAMLPLPGRAAWNAL